jgi:hypothetical protein
MKLIAALGALLPEPLLLEPLLLEPLLDPPLPPPPPQEVVRSEAAINTAIITQNRP